MERGERAFFKVFRNNNIRGFIFQIARTIIKRNNVLSNLRKYLIERFEKVETSNGYTHQVPRKHMIFYLSSCVGNSDLVNFKDIYSVISQEHQMDQNEFCYKNIKPKDQYLGQFDRSDNNDGISHTINYKFNYTVYEEDGDDDDDDYVPPIVEYINKNPIKNQIKEEIVTIVKDTENLKSIALDLINRHNALEKSNQKFQEKIDSLENILLSSNILFELSQQSGCKSFGLSFYFNFPRVSYLGSSKADFKLLDYSNLLEMDFKKVIAYCKTFNIGKENSGFAEQGDDNSTHRGSCVGLDCHKLIKVAVYIFGPIIKNQNNSNIGVFFLKQMNFFSCKGESDGEILGRCVGCNSMYQSMIEFCVEYRKGGYQSNQVDKQIFLNSFDKMLQSEHSMVQEIQKIHPPLPNYNETTSTKRKLSIDINTIEGNNNKTRHTMDPEDCNSTSKCSH